MNFYEIKNKKTEVYPAILSESLLNIKTRRKLRKTMFYLLITLFILILIGTSTISQTLNDGAHLLRAIFLLVFSSWISLYLLELMYLSYYFKDTNIDFEILKIVQNTKENDITLAFVKSDLGQYALTRLGITKKEIENFLKERTDFVTASEYEIFENDDNRVSFAEYGYSLLHFDSDFNKLIKSKGATVSDFKNTLEWVSRLNRKIRDNEQWWSRDRLMKIPAIGKNWAFGQIYNLQRFGHSIYFDNSYIHLGDKGRLFNEMTSKVEKVLLKDRGANVMLISRESYLGMEVTAALGHKIAEGEVEPKLENKRIYVLDANLLIGTYEDKSQFETMLNKILRQSAKAGNIILVMPHMSDFVENSKAIGSDVKDLISEALSSTKLQVVGISSSRGFHESLETDLDLMRNFEKIVVEDLDNDSTIELIQDEVQVLEFKNKIFFTYQALKTVVQSADRYFSEGTLTDKAVDILHEVTSSVLENSQKLVTKEIVLDIVEQKTGVPMGVLSKSEKDKLAKVEMKLKSRIIGQDKAIENVSEALKRARLGVANPQRPLGSFLFIGPTGVGKTETSKALANVFFGEDEDMLRIDMSEYNSQDSVERLIGDSHGNPGTLSSKVRERQYGVLLLDEFEKAHIEVHNLFLQILDEGFFSDGLGERVNARNLIIIATSNAGSELIYSAQKENLNLKSEKDEVVDWLIKERKFKPELLNRFDDIILFNPLSDKSLEIIVSLMIDKLNKRIEDKGINVEVNEYLTKYLVQAGENKEFGAREINRVIQREIETKIAEAMIDGNIKSGDTITFVESKEGIDVKRLI